MAKDHPDDEHISRHALQEMSFSTHILSLNAMALMHLGLIEGEDMPPRDLEAARHVIDTLVMLRLKTQGNLTPEEQQLLDALLHELRLAVVRAA